MKKLAAKLTIISVISFISLGLQASTINANELSQSGIQLVKVKDVMPSYPSSALNDKTQGTVTLSYDLNTQGQPVNIKVVNFKGSKRFIRSSIKALENSRFEPVTANNSAVSVMGLQKEYEYLMLDDSNNKRLSPGFVAFNI
ncbi:TonB family protein [Alteromonas sp. 5E99-2]|uniref:energy transducer TonB n=1 Tax=Alteromonas sp. 5E99-2 TaxID=2817683 RepID=UPI001A9A009F|nr:energy transducer TonB [Alteromonas sp. 5E99-2]MBO1254436.1 TonB family protein [Alteromonas sp. 5E99-2]